VGMKVLKKKLQKFYIKTRNEKEQSKLSKLLTSTRRTGPSCGSKAFSSLRRITIDNYQYELMTSKMKQVASEIGNLLFPMME
jgi:hypothetical protein